MEIPKAKYAWYGGSGTWGQKTMDFPSISPLIERVEQYPGVQTDRGETAPFHILYIQGTPIIYYTMHGWHPDHSQPTWESSYKTAWISKQAGVEMALVEASVGGIAHPNTGEPLKAGTAVVTHDYIRYLDMYFPPIWDTRRSARMGRPLCDGLRKHLYAAALEEPWFREVVPNGVYGYRIGPFETQAEILKLKQDGCHIVGQTLSPEAYYCRQLGIHFASLNLVSNLAEGITDDYSWVGDDEPDAMGRFYKEECPPPMIRTMARAFQLIMQHGIGDVCMCDHFKLTNVDGLPANYA